MDTSEVPSGGILLIDWGCGFCQRTRRWIEAHAPPDRFVFLALDSDEGSSWLKRCGRDPDVTDTVVHVTMGKEGLRCSGQSTAVLRTIRHMDRPYRWLYVGVVVPRPLRDLGYRLVSRNRHRLV